MLHDGTINAYQLKTVQANKNVITNLRSAVKQLKNAPANNKIIDIRVKNGTWEEFQEIQAKDRRKGLENIADEYPGMKLNITFSDGVTKSWLF
jgi:hypothetical protein